MIGNIEGDKLLKLVFKELSKQKLLVAITLFFILLGKVLVLAGPSILKALVDAYSSKDAPNELPISYAILLVILYVGAIFISNLFSEMKEFLATVLSQKVLTKVAIRIFSDIHRQPIDLHIKRQSGIITREIDRGLRAIQLVINSVAVNFLPAVIEFAIISIYLAYSYSVGFSLIFLATLISYIAFNYFATQKVIDLKNDWNKADSNLSHKLVDSLLNVESIRIFNNENYEKKRFEFLSKINERAFLQVQKFFSFLLSGQQLIVCLGLGLALWMAVANVHSGEMSIGDVVLIVSVMSQIFSPLNYLGVLYKDVKQALVDIYRLDILTGSKSSEHEDVGGHLGLINPPKIIFDRVSFAFESGGKQLDELQFTIQPGSTTALVGYSGSGKSLVTKLLFRFYLPTSGKIFINDFDIQNLQLSSLRQLISMVPQDISLFNDTIFNNIAYGNLSLTEEDIYRAVKELGMEEFILSLPDGYNTMVGERGLLLSGGERQRIAVARAFLKKTPILILDEATSSLDLDAEKRVYEFISQIKPKPTVIVIAHRLSAITNVDQILMFDRGKIVAKGLHGELYEANSAYRDLWNAQKSI